MKVKLWTKTESIWASAFLLCAVALTSIAAVQTPNRIFQVFFHAAERLILLEGHMNGNPAALLLGTGSNVNLLI